MLCLVNLICGNKNAKVKVTLFSHKDNLANQFGTHGLTYAGVSWLGVGLAS